MKIADQKSRTALEKANMFNEYFISVYNPGGTCETENLQHSLVCNFDTSPEKVCAILRELDITKATGPDGIPPYFLRCCAEGLAKSPSFIFRKAKETGKFPSCWKISCIKPLHKEGAKDKVANYRPVALLSCVRKVFEKCIYDKRLEIVEPHISECQFGFRGGRSSVLQLLVSLNKIVESKVSSKATHAVYLDLKKVDHSILVAKLEALGVSGRLLKIIKSYLHDRRQFVQIDDAKSSERKVTSGVPQGSRLGPLFLVYINDLPEAINDFFVSVFLMADDRKLIASGASLQRSLTNLENWSLANKMEFHPSKTKIVIFSGLQPEYKLCNESIGAVNSHRDLGLIVSSNLLWSEHISRRLGKAYGSLNLLKRNVSTKLRVSAKLNLYKSTVVAVISDASPCWYASRGDMRKLELLQRRAMKWILPTFSDCKERLVYLEVLPIPLPSNAGRSHTD